jgi:hypothetical protein
MRLGLVTSVAFGCSPPAPPAPPLPPSTVAVPLPGLAPAAPPSLTTAGATACTLRDAIVLGTHAGGSPVLAFATTGGLVAWTSARGALAVQALAPDGTPRSPATTTAIAAGFEPRRIDVVANGFVVQVAHQAERWGRIDVDASGRITQPFSAQPSPPPAPPSVTAPDALAFRIENAAEPPPHHPGGPVIEALGEPVLVREHAGTSVGERTPLVWHGNSIAHSMNVSFDIAWSGEVFLYPFYAEAAGDRYVDALLPIDCR